MTDYQLRAIMAMVYGMLAQCESVEDYEAVRRHIAKLGGELCYPVEDEQNKKTEVTP
jgi:hypothetical protein